MNLEDLIFRPVIGKRYLLNYRPFESLCPHCGQVGYTALRKAEGEMVECTGCRKDYKLGEGFYAARTDTQYRGFAVPYPLLEEIKEEDYD